MADIDLEAAVERGADHVVDVAVAVDEAARMAGERVGENVARPQQRDDAGNDGVGVLAIGAALRQPPELAEMNIDRQPGPAPDPKSDRDGGRA